MPTPIIPANEHHYDPVFEDWANAVTNAADGDAAAAEPVEF